MAERYIKLFSLAESADNPKVPIKIIAGAVYHDSVTYKTLIQLKYRNECDYTVESFKINVLLFNKSGEKIKTEVSHFYQSINKRKGEEFGDNEPVVASDIDDLGSVQVNIMDVTFSDGTEWVLGQNISERKKQEIGIIVKRGVGSVKEGEPKKGLELFVTLPDDYEKKKELVEYAKEAIREKAYTDAQELKDIAKTKNDFINAANAFEKLGDYKDSAEYNADCLRKSEEIRAQDTENEYVNAIKAMEEAKTEEEYNAVANRFAKLTGYKNTDKLLTECRKEIENCRKNEKYNSAVAMLESNKLDQLVRAKKLFGDLDNWRDSQEQIKRCDLALNQLEANSKRRKKVIIASVITVVAISVAIFGVNYYLDKKDEAELEKIRNTICKDQNGNKLGIISAAEDYTVAVKKDGTVVSTKIKGKEKDEVLYRDEVDDLDDIVSVVAGTGETYALKRNGKVYDSTTKYTGKAGPLEDWDNIVAIASSSNHTLGLVKNGTLKCVYNKENDYGQTDVKDWKDIIAISAGEYHSVGLTKQGKVVSTKIKEKEDDEEYGIISECGQTEVDKWTDIVAISAGEHHTVGLRKDGTVVSTKITVDTEDYGQTDVDKWKNIVAISAGTYYTVGLKKDGTVVAASGDDDFDNNDDMNSKVEKWTDIVAISAGTFHIVGVKKDGTVVSTDIENDNDDYGQTDVEDWKDII